MSVKCPSCDTENTSDSQFCKKCATPLLFAGDLSVTKTLETPAKGLALGSTFAGRYQIVAELGQGGMGAVYRAMDTRINEEVAIKLIRPEIAADEKVLERFSNELKLARKIGHKNVCKMFHLDMEGEIPYISMEYLEGQDLKKMIWEKQKLPAEEAVGIAQQVCEGLVEAHRLGVVHRDLKPQNIMIDKEGQAKIMDFGIARSIEAPGVTQTGVIIGTPDYISPEQAEGQEADHRSDIYSLGVILYEMVTGSVPFKGDTALSVALKHKAQLPLDPRKRNPAIPDDLSRLILICMEKDKNRRFQSAKDLLDDLRNIEHGLPLGTKIRPTKATFIQKLIHNRLFIPALVVVIAILGVFIWKSLSREEIVAAPKIENSIAVISFRNDTGDEANDSLCHRSIPNWLLANLENSGLFRVMTWEWMTDVLKQMGKKDVEFIDSDLGYELCLREGIAYICSGSLAKSGEIFVSDIKIFDAESKELIKPVQSKGEGANSIIQTQIDELSVGICESLGASLEEIGEGRLNIAGVTTSSLKAYEHYLNGIDHFWRWQMKEAKAAYEKAIEIDPSFASAYRKLATVCLHLSDRKTRREAIAKAEELSTHATEKERLYIQVQAAAYKGGARKCIPILEEIISKYPKEKEAHYWLAVNISLLAPPDMKDNNRGIREFETALELDPNFAEASIQLGILYSTLGNFEKSIECLKRGASLDPENANAHASMGNTYFMWGKLDKAVASMEKANKMNPDMYNVYWALAFTEALRENYKEALDWLDRLIERSPPPGFQRTALLVKGFLNFWLGRFDQSLLDLKKTEELGENVNSNDWLRAMIYFVKGDYENSRVYLSRFYEWIIKSSDVVFANYGKVFGHFFSGMIDLKQGNLEPAKDRLEEITSLFQTEEIKEFWQNYPIWEDWHNNFLDILDCEIALFEKKPDIDKILRAFDGDRAFLDRRVGPYNAGQMFNLNDYPFVRDYIPRAYIQNGDLDKAIEAYERLVTFNPESADRRLIHPLNYYRLGKVYEQMGNNRKAKANYRKFLRLWQDSDPGITEVEDAKRRLAKL